MSAAMSYAEALTPTARRACQRALEAAERAAETLREVLAEPTTAEPPADLLTVKHAAAEFGVSVCTARRWARRWGLRRGGVLFVSRSAVVRCRPGR